MKPNSVKKPVHAATDDVEWLLAEDGHAIPMRHWQVEQPIAVIHIAHGMSEHSGCYEDVAARFNAAGFAVVAHDHRCHGLSVAREALGNISKEHHWETICADMRSMNREIKHLYPELPLILLGHSMGSFIALTYAERHSHSIDALILEGTSYTPPWFSWGAHVLAKFECWRQGENARSALIHALTFGKFAKAFGKQAGPYDWLSRDGIFVHRFMNDPLCGVLCSNGFWRELLGGLNRTHRLDNLRKIRKDLPIYSFAGGNDPMSENAHTVAVLDDKLESVGMINVTMKIYDDARHDVLHETNKEEVYHDLLAWLTVMLDRLTQPSCELK